MEEDNLKADVPNVGEEHGTSASASSGDWNFSTELANIAISDSKYDNEIIKSAASLAQAYEKRQRQYQSPPRVYDDVSSNELSGNRRYNVKNDTESTDNELSRKSGSVASNRKRISLFLGEDEINSSWDFEIGKSSRKGTAESSLPSRSLRSNSDGGSTNLSGTLDGNLLKNQVVGTRSAIVRRLIDPSRPISEGQSKLYAETTGFTPTIQIEQSNFSINSLSRRQDRFVTTSYQGSIDEINFSSATGSKSNVLPSEPYSLRRLNNLSNQPVSSVGSKASFSELSPPTNPRPLSSVAPSPDEITSGGPAGFYDDIHFIQYASQEIQFARKTKPAKVIGGRYIVGDILGEGSYGKVKEGFSIDTLKRVAIKILKKNRLKKIPNGLNNVEREINLLWRLSHKNIIQMTDVIFNDEKEKIYVVFEYCAATLNDLMERSPFKMFPRSQAQSYFRQLIKGLGYLHSKSIVHRDIKPGNLLVSVDGTIKITDFGVAEQLSMYDDNDLMTSSLGSPAFQPPEVALGKESFSGFKADVWATGITLYNLISGKYPFSGKTIYYLFDSIAKCKFEVPKQANGDELLRSLLLGMLEKDPNKRLSTNDISEHEWIHITIPRSKHEVPINSPDYDSPMNRNMLKSSSHSISSLYSINSMVGNSNSPSRNGSIRLHSRSNQNIKKRQSLSKTDTRPSTSGSSSASGTKHSGKLQPPSPSSENPPGTNNQYFNPQNFDVSKTGTSYQRARDNVVQKSSLSNPNFATDTTLIPYLEALFPEMSSSYERCSSNSKMGGGTLGFRKFGRTLKAGRKRLMSAAGDMFNVGKLWEYTLKEDALQSDDELDN